jgi:F0F1-type ATP synthase assembly protein I
LRQGLRHLGLGVELIAPLLAGLFGGYWLDGKLGTSPWFLITGTVLGFAAGFLNFFRAVLPRKGRDGDEGNGS